MRFLDRPLARMLPGLLALLLASLPGEAQACLGAGGAVCGVTDSCCSGLSCVAGVCIDLPDTCQGEGALCTASSQCCGDRVCQLGSCRTQRQAGETCGPLAPCEDPLVCDFSTDGITLRCRHDPPVYGEACSVFVPCDDGLACTALTTQRCVHSPARDGEFCDAAAPCGDRLFCEPFSQTCEPVLGVGDYCDPILDKCADGLVCLPCEQKIEEGCYGDGACFPNLDIDRQAFSEQECLDIYDPLLHHDVMLRPPDNGRKVVTYGTGRQIVGVFGATEEIGAAYDSEGRYGCFKTLCFGLETDVEIAGFTSIGNYVGWNNLKGASQAAVVEAGQGVNFSLVRISAPDQDPVFGELGGVEEAWSLGISGSPIPASIGAYLCDTEVVGVVGNEPPTARCADAQVCADALTCEAASASIDDGSDDPDGDPITLAHSPPGPHAIGDHQLTLTVSDTSGDSDSCSAGLTVDDCTAPELVCPPDVAAECAANGATTLDPGDATASDCTATSVSDPGPASYPLGTTDVSFTASDAFGNESSCTTQVTVVDTTPPLITSLTASPALLWPPNHKLSTITVSVEASDACDPAVQCGIVSVASDEPDAGLDEDDLPGDIQAIGGISVQLRAERSSDGAGRRYGITVECADATGGGATRATTQVLVPHDEGG